MKLRVEDFSCPFTVHAVARACPETIHGRVYDNGANLGGRSNARALGKERGPTGGEARRPMTGAFHCVENLRKGDKGSLWEALEFGRAPT
eukprot:1659101-Amphidinium_carterae.1